MWSVNMLAREVTRWTAACDRRLRRSISWMHHSGAHMQICYVGDKPSDCNLVRVSDASFAGDLKDSKSTSGGVLCLVDPNTYVPINWLCKKQTAVSHSTSESEVIALDAGVRMEGLPALLLSDLVIEVFEPRAKPVQAPKLSVAESDFLKKQTYDMFRSVDFVPPSLPITYGRAVLYILEDNDAVIKMCIKERSPSMKHVARTHRVNLDWLFERINRDPAVFMKFVETKEQSADILTKGSFTADTWLVLCNLCLIIPIVSFDPSAELKELKNLRAGLSVALCSNTFSNMFSKPAT